MKIIYSLNKITLPCVELTGSRSVNFFWLKWSNRVDETTLNKIISDVSDDGEQSNSYNTSIVKFVTDRTTKYIGSEHSSFHYLFRHTLGDYPRFYTCIVVNKFGHDFHTYLVSPRTAPPLPRYVKFQNIFF